MNDVSPRGSVSVTSAEVCDRGKVREENQDNVRSATIPLGKLFIVADGIGGYQGGATASRMVVDGFSSQLAAKPANYPPDRALQEACDYTNLSIHNAAGSSDASLQRMGSTVVLALVQMAANGVPIAWIGHVGDSRAYLIRGGKMAKLTSDHSAVQALLSRNLITEEEARNHPDASVLTRSLGHRADVEIEIDRVDLQPGDALLLCSDGLWGYVADADIAMVATDASLSVQTAAETLLHQALAAGGQDNIGIEFVRIGGAMPIAAATPDDGPTKTMGGSHRNQMLLAIGLLLLGGCGGLGYAAYSHNWLARVTAYLHKDSVHKGDSPSENQPAAGVSTTDPKPQRGTEGSRPKQTGTAKDKTTSTSPEQEAGRIGVVGEIPEAAQEHKHAASRVWQHISIKRSEYPACFLRAKAGTTIVYSDLAIGDMGEALDQHSELKPWVQSQKVENHKMDAKVKKDCGDFEVVVILPEKHSTIPPAGEAPESSKPTEQQSHPNQQSSQDPQARMLPLARPAQFPAHPPARG
jgi:serine/threonine protein phosphatase PrpC/predicted GIY-YIG superfamily endonuclease